MKFTFEPESKPLPGYTIKRAIHRGGFGEVYYALSDAGKEVALKLLHDNMDIELRGVSHCLNLKHPNLVTIFDIRTDADGDHWVVMEYVAGKNLDAELDSYPNGMPMELVRTWLHGIVEGVSFLHDRGIVHRDLKPANIYLENGVVKTGDVGLSKYITPSRRSAHTQSVGTVYYMAPEVAHGRYGREVDVYSTGIILYEMLTGHVPFDGESTGEILMKHLSEKPDLSPIPPRLRPVLAAALEKDPQKRTSSVERLYEGFSRAVVGKSIPETHVRPRDAARDPENIRQPAPGGPTAAKRADQRLYEAQVRLQEARGRLHERRARKAERRARRRFDRRARRRRHAAFWRVFAIGVLVLLLLNPRLFGRLGWMEIFICAALMYPLYRLVVYLLSTSWTRFDEWAHRDAGGRRSGTEFMSTTQPGAPLPPPVAEKPASVYRTTAAPNVRKTVPPWRAAEWSPMTPRRIDLRSRLSDLSASMALAVVCTAVMTAGLATFSEWFPHDGGYLGLFGITALIGAWGILIPAKLFEGTALGSGSRRFCQLLFGVLLGTTAFWLQRVLMANPTDFGTGPLSYVGPFSLFEPRAWPFLDAHHGQFVFHTRFTQPALAGYIAFFGSLFVLRRWWYQADAFRPKRFSVGSLLYTAGLGLLLCFLFSFPPIWGVTWTAVISGVVQLSTNWIPQKQRAALVEGPPNATT